jgi:CRP/FNR family transcriptional regulator
MKAATPLSICSVPATNSCLLRGLPQANFAKLMASARPMILQKGGTLFDRGDPGDGCYLLQNGVVKVTVQASTGEERIVAILGPGTMVGELAMLDGLPRSATVVAMSLSQLLFLPQEAFRKTAWEDPAINRLLMLSLVERLRQADAELAAASFLTVRARVARALLILALHLGERTTQPDQVLMGPELRQGDLASLAGVTRETVSRTLSAWCRVGVLERLARSTYGIDLKKLDDESRFGE